MTKILNIGTSGMINHAIASENGDIYCTTSTEKLYKIPTK